MKPHQTTGSYAVPAAVFLVFSVFYILLRSNDFFAVDGSFRCLEVYRYPELFFRSNNHLMYTPDVLGWTRLAAAVGYKPAGPVEFLGLVELMNCLAGAAALAIFCSLLRGVTQSWRIAAGMTAALGLTRAFSAQAVNSNEPMPAVLWSFLAIALAARSFQRKSVWPAIASGIFFGLAMATYRSMVLLSPAAAVLLLLGDPGEAPRFVLVKGRVERVAALVFSGVVSAASLHAWAYWESGERTAAGMARQFGATEGSEFYFGLRLGRLLNLPIGMARNFFAVQTEYTGARAFFSGPKGPVLFMFLLIAAILAFLAFCALQIARNWSGLGNVRRTGVIAGCVGLAFTFIPVLLWDPQYDKLWVQPLACVFFLVGIALSLASAPVGAMRIVAWACSILAVVGLGVNLHWTYEEHVNDPIEFEEAREAAQLIGKNDFVAGDWRSVGLLYGYLWAEPGQFISFPTEAIAAREQVVDRLRGEAEETAGKSGKLYFFGILDVPKAEWDSFFGERCGIPYSDLDDYRARAKVRARYWDKHGESLLWQGD